MDTHWPLLQVGLCFAGEMVLFVKSCSMGLSPLSLSQPLPQPQFTPVPGFCLLPSPGSGVGEVCLPPDLSSKPCPPGPLSHVPCSQNLLGGRQCKEPGPQSSQPLLTLSHRATEPEKGSAAFLGKNTKHFKTARLLTVNGRKKAAHQR